MRPHPDEALPVAALPTGEQVVGLLPAGGQGTRIGPLPCGAELFPIGFRSHEEGQDLRPKVVPHYLLKKMRLAEIHSLEHWNAALGSSATSDAAMSLSSDC